MLVNGCTTETVHIWPLVNKSQNAFEKRYIFSIFENLFTIFSCLLTIFQKNLPPLKHILALPTWGQKSTQTELQPFEIGNFDLGHPVFDPVVTPLLN